MTFSIVARCSRTGALGVAVSTAVPAVGAMCVYLRSGVGAVSTQSWVNPYLALNALDALEQGADAEQALAQVLKADPAADLRQLGIVDSHGRSAASTGAQCTGWAGQRTGASYSIQGNMLTGAATLDAMQAAFDASATFALEERLMRALEAGQAAGGDKRGRQSAAIKVVRDEAYACVDLRVDEHGDPVAELPARFRCGARAADALRRRHADPRRPRPLAARRRDPHAADAAAVQTRRIARAGQRGRRAGAMDGRRIRSGPRGHTIWRSIVRFSRRSASCAHSICRHGIRQWYSIWRVHIGPRPTQRTYE